MPRTRDDIAQAAEAAADLIENLSDDDVEFRPAADMRALGLALAAVAAAEANLAACVDVCRENGRTWPEIGMVLGVSKQAAAKRYGEPVVPAQR